MPKNSKCTEKKGEANRNFQGELCYKFSLWRSNCHKKVSHLLATREQIKCRLCGLGGCLWQEAQEISLHVKSQNLVGATCTACTHTKIKTWSAPSYVETYCGWLAKPPECALPVGISGIQTPFWLLIKEGLGRLPHLQKELFWSCVWSLRVSLLLL